MMFMKTNKNFVAKLWQRLKRKAHIRFVWDPLFHFILIWITVVMNPPFYCNQTTLPTTKSLSCNLSLGGGSQFFCVRHMIQAIAVFKIPVRGARQSPLTDFSPRLGPFLVRLTLQKWALSRLTMNFPTNGKLQMSND